MKFINKNELKKVWKILVLFQNYFSKAWLPAKDF